MNNKLVFFLGSIAVLGLIPSAKVMAQENDDPDFGRSIQVQINEWIPMINARRLANPVADKDKMEAIRTIRVSNVNLNVTAIAPPEISFDIITDTSTSFQTKDLVKCDFGGDIATNCKMYSYKRRTYLAGMTTFFRAKTEENLLYENKAESRHPSGTDFMHLLINKGFKITSTEQAVNSELSELPNLISAANKYLDTSRSDPALTKALASLIGKKILPANASEKDVAGLIVNHQATTGAR